MDIIIFKFQTNNVQKQIIKSQMNYPRSDHIDESVDFDKYIGGSDDDQKYDQSNQRHKHLLSQQLNMQINRINMKLEGICSERLGDLNSTSPRNIQKTVQLVETLISQIKKFQQVKTKLVNDRRQAQQSSTQNEQIIDKINREKKSLETQKQSMFQKFKNLEKIHKQFLDKFQLQRQQLNKQIKQFQTRQKSFEAQFRKKQNQIKSLQDGLRKFQQKAVFKNSFDVIQKFQYGPNIYDLCSTNGQNQYGRLARDSNNESVKKLIDQNQYLKQCLSNVYKQLNTVLQLKRQTLRNKKGYDGQYDSYFQLNYFRAEALNLPESWSRQKLKQLNENIQKFKQAIKLGDFSDAKIDDKKQTCVNGIKQLIKNYKQVVETQDQLLNKVLLKSKQFKATEIAHLQNRFSKVLDSNQLDRAKRFVEEQAQYLQSKNAQLQKTRKLMQAAMKKAEQNKKQMVKQRQVFEEEALQMRRSVEVLPAMIQEQLGRALH